LYRDHIAVVLEKGFCNLDTYLETPNIEYGDKIAITSRILSIVESIHRIKLVWMDLKPSNIVLFPTQHDGITVWKGIDVDGSLRVGDIVQNASFVGTLAYMAPELFQPTSVIKASPVLDVWSVGMLVFRLFKNKSFWSCCHIEESDGESLKGYLKTVTNEDMVRIIESEFHSIEFSSLRNFLKSALQVNPQQRSSIDSLKQMSLVRGGASITASAIFNQIGLLNRKMDHVQVQGEITHAKLTVIEEKVDEISDSIKTSFSVIRNESSLAFQCLSQTLMSHTSDISVQLNTIHERISSIIMSLESAPPTLSDFESVTGELRDVICEQVRMSVLEIGDKQTAEAMNHFDQMNTSLQSLMEKMKSNEQNSLMRDEHNSALLAEYKHYLIAVGDNVKRVVDQTSALDAGIRDIHSVMHSVKSDIYKGNTDMITTMRQLREEITSALNSFDNNIITALGQGNIASETDIASLSESVAIMNQKLSSIAENGNHVVEVKQLLSHILTKSPHTDCVGVMGSDELLLVIELLKNLKMELSDVRADMSEMRITMNEVKFACGKQLEILSAIVCGGYNIPALPLIVPDVATTRIGKLKSLFEVCIFNMLYGVWYYNGDMFSDRISFGCSLCVLSHCW
jgi:serine/threonine protein kinase